MKPAARFLRGERLTGAMLIPDRGTLSEEVIKGGCSNASVDVRETSVSISWDEGASVGWIQLRPTRKEVRIPREVWDALQKK